MYLLVHFALEKQISSIQEEAKEEADIIHSEAGPVKQ